MDFFRGLFRLTETGGDVVVKHLKLFETNVLTLSEENGVGASGGWLNGRDVYEWVDFITDETPDPLILPMVQLAI